MPPLPTETHSTGKLCAVSSFGRVSSFIELAWLLALVYGIESFLIASLLTFSGIRIWHACLVNNAISGIRRQ